MLKGLNKNTTLDELKEELDSLKLTDVKITKVSELKTKTNYTKIFLVQCSAESNIKKLTAINKLLFQIVKWESLKKEEVVQCKKCQRLGHVASNCNLSYRCVKCAKSHQPGECTVTATTKREELYCANCEKHGHPASYRGCPIIKTHTAKKLANATIADISRKQRILPAQDRPTYSQARNY